MSKQARPRPGLLGNWREVMSTCNLADGRRPDVVSRWLILTRACVQPMTLTAAAVAGLLAVRAPGFRVELFALSAVGIVVAHAANNLINDFFDLDLGQDTESYPRALYAPHPVLSGMITRGGLLRAILVLNAVDVVILALLLVERGWRVAAFAVAGLFISVFYVAPPLRLKLHGLGEPSVFMIWGPLMVGGTYYSATGALPRAVVWASIPYALLVTSVLMGKHLDKAPWDREQGVRTLPVLLGDRSARRFTVGLVVAFYAALAVEVMAGMLPIWTLAAIAAFPQAVRLARIYATPKPAEPPEDYPVWPLWFVSWAFRHSRRAGALFVLGLAAGAIWPTFVRF